MLVLKRVYRARVQTEMVEFIAWPFASSSKLKICSFHVIVVLGRQRKCTKKRDARAELLFCQTKRIVGLFDVAVALAVATSFPGSLGNEVFIVTYLNTD